MAKKIVRYLLEGNGTIPVFVENGGHYQKGAELVGLSVDEDERHVPATVIRMTKAELKSRIISLRKDGDGNWLNDLQGSPYSAARVTEELANFLTQLGVPDYE